VDPKAECDQLNLAVAHETKTNKRRCHNITVQLLLIRNYLVVEFDRTKVILLRKTQFKS